jgi:hypothetical protein
MSEKSTKVSQNFFGDVDIITLSSGFRVCYVYLYFLVNLRITSKGMSLAQIRMDENWVIKDLFRDQKLFMDQKEIHRFRRSCPKISTAFLNILINFLGRQHELCKLQPILNYPNSKVCGNFLRRGSRNLEKHASSTAK